MLHNRLKARVEVILVGVEHTFLCPSVAQCRHGGDDGELGAPRVREGGGDLQRLQPPLGFVGADRNTRDRVAQVHDGTVVVGVRHHNDRAVCVCRQAGARGAQQAFRQAAFATVADDDEIVVAAQFHEDGTGVTGHNECLGAHALLVGDGLRLGQDLFGIRVRDGVITHRGIRGVERHRRVTGQRICADNLQGKAGMLSIVRRPPRCLEARVRSIDTHKNRLVVFGSHGCSLPSTSFVLRAMRGLDAPQAFTALHCYRQFPTLPHEATCR